MNRPDQAKHYTTFWLDYRGYSKLSPVDQRDVQHDLAEIEREALAELGLTVATEDRQPTGDGMLSRFRADISPADLVANLPAEIGFALARRNRHRLPDHRRQVRLAMDRGLLEDRPLGWVGDPAVDTERLVSAKVGRDVLADHPEAAFVLLLSPRLYVDAVVRAHRGLPADVFANSELSSEEKGAGLTAWVTYWDGQFRLPEGHHGQPSGHDRPPTEASAPAAAAAAAHAGEAKRTSPAHDIGGSVQNHDVKVGDHSIFVGRDWSRSSSGSQPPGSRP